MAFDPLAAEQVGNWRAKLGGEHAVDVGDPPPHVDRQRGEPDVFEEGEHLRLGIAQGLVARLGVGFLG